MKDYKDRDNFILITTFWKCLVPKMHLKSAPQKQNFVLDKAISKGYTLDCGCRYPCTCPHCYAL